MKRQILTTLLLTTIAGSSSLITHMPTPAIAKPPQTLAARDIYTKTNPAVVTIRTNRGHGSGFIINASGYIITNAHVAKNAPQVLTVMMADGKTEMPADVVGYGRNGLDLAILKINNRKKLPTIPLGNQKSVQVGDRVYAIGTPFSEVNQSSFSTGIVSGVREKGHYIQHDTVINNGSSGGPLLNEKGEVIGVNTLGAPSPVICKNGKPCGYSTGNTGVNYAIGIDAVQVLLQDFKKGNLSYRPTI